MNATQIQFQQRLVQEGLVNKPADRIVNRPGKEVWQHAGNPNQMFERLCRNFHHFGRTGGTSWQWVAGSGGIADGKPLLAGQINSTNCGGFNRAARWLAEHVCGINGSAGTYTNANDYFITLSNCTVLDRTWHGSVRTLSQDFAQLKAFFFMGHSWSQLNGLMYDATTKQMGFTQQSDLVWCELMKTRNSGVGGNPGRAFMVSRTIHPPAVPIPGTPPYTCISTVSLKHFRHMFPIVWTGPGAAGPTQSFISALPDTTGSGWPSFVLLAREHLPADFRNAVGPL